jgi:hypothetical protein
MVTHSKDSSRRLATWKKFCEVFEVAHDNAVAETYLYKLRPHTDAVVCAALSEAIDTFEPGRDTGRFPRPAFLLDLCRKAKRDQAPTGAVEDLGKACTLCAGRGVVFVFRPRWAGELVYRDRCIRRKTAEKDWAGSRVGWFLVGLRCSCARGETAQGGAGPVFSPLMVRSLGWAMERADLAAELKIPDYRFDAEGYKVHCEAAIGTIVGNEVVLPSAVPFAPVEGEDDGFDVVF